MKNKEIYLEREWCLKCLFKLKNEIFNVEGECFE
jgi:hypothetical protein